MAKVVWITGLPGSGKSSVALALKRRRPEVLLLQMDELRKVATPRPTYSEAEREVLYRALVWMARLLWGLGYTVVIDATGHRRAWRQLARKLIGGDFAEVYLRCPLRLCMQREASRGSRVYERAREGWPVPGLSVPYEEPQRAELVVDTQRVGPEEAAERLLGLLDDKI